MPEYEAHLGSYDHTHNQRLRDLKKMKNNPFGKETSDTARKNAEKEKKAAGMTSVKLEPASEKKSGGGFKKGGFKSAFKPANTEESKVEEGKDVEVKKEQQVAIPGLPVAKQEGDGDVDMQDEDEEEGEDQSRDYSFWSTEDPGYRYYDPTRPGDCGSRCACKAASQAECKKWKGCELCVELGPVPG